MINNAQDLSKYYSLVNQYIDEYLDKGIKASKLHKYLSKDRLNSFLERKGLKDIKKIEQVVKDVLEDRVSLEKDVVLTFESFNFLTPEAPLDSIRDGLYQNINKAGISHEKILADHFDVSLSQISLESTTSHQFTIDDFSDSPVSCIIFTADDLVAIQENLVAIILPQLLAKSVSLDYGLSVEIRSFVDPAKLEQYLNGEYLNLSKVKGIISTVTGAIDDSHDAPYYLGIIKK